MGTGINNTRSLEGIVASIPLTRNTWYISVPAGSDYCFFNGYIHKYIKDKVSEYNTLENIENLVIGAHLYEPSAKGDITEWIQKSLDYCSETKFLPNLKNVYVLYDSMVFNIDKINTKFNINKVRFSYFLLRSTLTKERVPNFIVKPWAPNTKRALFLPGDVLRINRFPVIYEFYINQNLDKLEYSFDYNYISRFNDFEHYTKDPHFQQFKNFVYDAYSLDEAAFKKRCKFLQRKLVDDDFAKTVQTGVFNHFDVSAYCFPKEWNTASLIVTMETQFQRIPYEQMVNNETDFFSEKMWKPILTKKPFILSSDKDFQYDILESLGFKTFLEYTSYPDKITRSFALTSDKSYYPKIAYKRIISFLENMRRYEKEISNDVEYNYNLWLTMGNKVWEKVYQECPVLKELSKIDLSNVFILGGENNYMNDQNVLNRIFY
jgi:hypothetical protein